MVDSDRAKDAQSQQVTNGETPPGALPASKLSRRRRRELRQKQAELERKSRSARKSVPATDDSKPVDDFPWGWLLIIIVLVGYALWSCNYS